ncbi:MAG TPA: hypothetical protein VGD95_08080 [Micavibrio sp.]
MKMKTLLWAALALGGGMMFSAPAAQAGDYCREYTRTVSIGGRLQTAYGTACYQPDGDWKIVDETDRSRIGQRFRDDDRGNSYYLPVSQPAYRPWDARHHYRPLPQPTRIVFVSDGHRHYGKKHHQRDRGHRHDRNYDDRHYDHGYRGHR